MISLVSACDPTLEAVLVTPSGGADVDGDPDLGAPDAGIDGGFEDAGVDLESALTVRMRFDETEGDVAQAESENNFVNGQVPASAVWRPSQGRVLGAVELNGEPVRLGNHDRYYPDNLPFTGAIWIRPVALSTTAVALVDFDPFFQFRAATDRLQLIRGRDSLTSSVGLTAGAWHHLAVVQTLEALELWLDGVNLGEVPTAPTVAGKANGRFGADAAVLFDDFRAYARALSPAELETLANP